MSIALHSNMFGEYWWTVQRGHNDRTACKCRLFVESDAKFTLYDGEDAWSDPYALTLRDRLVEKWSTLAGDEDGEYEAKMDALLCRLTNGKWSKTRSYDLDFMESCVNEEFEAQYAEDQADLVSHIGALKAYASKSRELLELEYRLAAGYLMMVPEDELTAAVWLANKNYMPVLQFKRVGDKLEVTGSNAYILVRGEIDASFSGWDDGVAVKLSESAPTNALLTMLRSFDVDEGPHELEIVGNCATYMIDGINTKCDVFFMFATTKPLDIEGLAGLASEAPEGRTLMASENLRTMAKLTKMLGFKHTGWYIEPHGKNKAMALRPNPENDTNNILIMAMPQREDA
jgi:hypothetical protein